MPLPAILASAVNEGADGESMNWTLLLPTSTVLASAVGGVV